MIGKRRMQHSHAWHGNGLPQRLKRGAGCSRRSGCVHTCTSRRPLLDKLRSGLCGMGFRRAEVDPVLRDLEALGELSEAAADQWLRAALLRLTRPVARGTPN
jgi:hypothetical protein